MSTVPTTQQVFGRKWELIVTTDSSDITVSSDKTDNPLRIEFNIYSPGYRAYWFAGISIYNLDGPTTETIITAGNKVTLKAGYDKSNFYGSIFDGKIFQPMWERMNVVDFKLTLHCVSGWELITNNFVNFVHSAYAKQIDLVRQMAANANSAIPIGKLSDKFKPTQLPRGRSMFGNPAQHFDTIAKDNNMQWWVNSGDEKLNMGSAVDQSSDEIIKYTPSSGILGTPSQIPANTAGVLGAPQVVQGGVLFKVLMDARLKVVYPAQQVQLLNTNIRQMLAQVGQTPTILDKDGLYKVGGVRHVGDTRGLDWYSEVTGYTLNYLADNAARANG